ncbi:MAG: GTPase Era [Rhodobiaceae bacterium]|nr:GTPase Era [Rhodobiaceae bacterium]|tara:strand:+ start:4535 stop:5422 length:888 start_codon:yes stop_codon:yes gene_type:complete
MNKKNITIGIIGPTNSGKSTLLNNIIGEKLAIVTHKSQTTRSAFKGIKIINETQMIFIDTPGIFNAKTKFEKAMLENAYDILNDVDLVFLLIDCKKSIDDFDENFLKNIKVLEEKIFLILNKIDLIERGLLLAKIKNFTDLFNFKETFLISAKNGDGVQDLLDKSSKLSNNEYWLYPEDQTADVPMARIASEITREKILLLLHEEIPYSSTVETESWIANKTKSITINQTIYVSKKNHVGIVLGKGGKMIKSIGIASREDIEKILNNKVNLKINVKFKRDWSTKKKHFEDIGLNF